MRPIFLLLVLLFPGAVLHSQTPDTEHKNFIHFNPLGILVGNIDFSYERAIGKRSTVALGVSPKVGGGIVRISGLDSPTIRTNRFGFSGFHLTPEYRWYLDKQSPGFTGLYVGGYYRYKNIRDNKVGTYTSSNTGTTAEIDLDVDVISHTLGVELGYKIILGKQFYLDFLVAGPGWTFGKMEIKENLPLPPEFYVDAAIAIIENFDILDLLTDDNLDLEEDGSGGGTGGFGLPAFRYTLKIAYSF